MYISYIRQINIENREKFLPYDSQTNGGGRLDTTAKNRTKQSNMITGLIIVLFSFLISTTGISFFLLYRDTIYSGVTIENVDVGGLSILEAQRKIQNHFERFIDNHSIQLTYGDKNWNISGRDIGYTYDYTKAANEAFRIGREGSYFERLQKIISLYKVPHNIALLPTYDHKKLDGILYDIKRKIDQPSRNATITRVNGKFHITEEKVGLKVNTEGLKDLIAEELRNNYRQETIQMDIPVEMASPKITSESLSFIQDLLGEYTTQFSATNKSRTQNIALAARTINGTVLMPGEIFSFNERVGPRTESRGYQNAPVIFKGELVDGLGGGICQVSSTMYNAILLSNLNIVERINHSIPSTYVPKGRDATVSYGVLDFKFQNILSQPIYIETFINGNLLTVRVYGYKTDNKVVKIESREDEVIRKTVEVKYDPNMYEGEEKIEQEGRDGYKVTTFKVIYENGVEIERKQISKDYYKPQKQIIVKGTKKRPIAPVQKPQSQEKSKPDEGEEATSP
ncbi:Vancomycin B-type resistance protein VanW [Thermotalea metallivorans]|uniref:Vancomycin B-type resistance protein VanW n=1 Tax=Thermotalea metallivorans TaxID=520762 RepID=A0A140LEF6_9FIRM|nr:Vancomycin B-type resistance protein VanW [Thermotalea metallivorans]